MIEHFLVLKSTLSTSLPITNAVHRIHFASAFDVPHLEAKKDATFRKFLLSTNADTLAPSLAGRCFGWKRTMLVGLDPKMVGLFTRYQAYITCAHQDLNFSTLLLVIIGFCLIGPSYYHNWEFYFCFILICWAVVCVLVSNHAIRSESKAMTIVTLVASFVPPLYLLARGISLAITHPPRLYPTLEDNMFILAFIVGFFALLTRALLCYLTYRVYKNFGLGLRDRGMYLLNAVAFDIVLETSWGFLSDTCRSREAFFASLTELRTILFY